MIKRFKHLRTPAYETPHRLIKTCDAAVRLLDYKIILCMHIYKILLTVTYKWTKIRKLRM